jgi:Peptidase family M48
MRSARQLGTTEGRCTLHRGWTEPILRANRTRRGRPARNQPRVWQGIRGITDVAVLPLAVIGLSVYLFLATPVTNTISRTMEFEADMYGLNAARQPDGEANVDMMLGEYRKLEPGPVEEFIFFDHPSGRTRITAAMRWKAEYPESASQEELSRPLFNTTLRVNRSGIVARRT